MDDFFDIFHKYYHLVYRFHYYLTWNVELAEQLTTSTFLKARLEYPKWSWRYYRARIWLLGIAMTVYQRSQTSRDWQRANAHDPGETVRNTDEDVRHFSTDQQAAHNALRTLDKFSQALLVLRYWEDLSVGEIAEITQCIPSARVRQNQV